LPPRCPTPLANSRSWEIDYCCRGTRSLGEVCAEAKISVDEVLARLQKSSAVTTPGESKDRQSQLLVDLIEHITSTHHVFVREERPRIDALAGKVVATVTRITCFCP
jgi:regulator of cell morphogenesis and NO signaling